MQRIRGGDIGSLPAVLGLVALFILFSALRPDTFPTAGNMANLVVQASPIVVLAMGLVFVLLLGDIDLSAGVAGGAAAGVMAKVMIDLQLPWFLGVAAGIGFGVAVGLLIGALVARVGIPSFVVTLALFLALQGVPLFLIGEGGTVPVRNEVIVAIANRNVPVAAGWVLTLVAVGGYAAVVLLGWSKAKARGLSRDAFGMVVARVVVVGLLLVGLTAVLSQNRARIATVELAGIPWSLPLIGVLLVVLTFVLARTTYGRHVYAVGGNHEAARRAGTSVQRIRISVFVLGSSLAALSGIIAASRLNSVTPDAGAGNTLLYAVGAAVIGGTSLFGGVGRVVTALLGALVIASIQNGMDLLGLASGTKFVITGIVLLGAVLVDAYAKRRRAARGVL